MADIEIDSFVRKLKLLRGAGVEASLNVETKTFYGGREIKAV